MRPGRRRPRPRAGDAPTPVHTHPEGTDCRNCSGEKSRARAIFLCERGLRLLVEPFRFGSDGWIGFVGVGISLGIGVPMAMASQYVLFAHQDKLDKETLDAANERDMTVLFAVLGASVAIGFGLFTNGFVATIGSVTFLLVGVVGGAVFYRSWNSIEKVGR